MRFGKPFAEIRPPRLSPKERDAREARDLELLNKYAEEMNAEAEEGLMFFVPAGYVLKKIPGRKRKSGRRLR
jgi:hypothetical protein